jgi:hypothetical protein
LADLIHRTIDTQLNVSVGSCAERPVQARGLGAAFAWTRGERAVKSSGVATGDLRRVGGAAVLVAMIYLSNPAGNPPR